MEVSATGAFSALENPFGGEAIQEAKEAMAGVTTFKMAATVLVFFFLFPTYLSLWCCTTFTWCVQPSASGVLGA